MNIKSKINPTMIYSWLAMLVTAGGFLLIAPIAKKNFGEYEFSFWLFSTTLVSTGQIVQNSLSDAFLRAYSNCKNASEENIKRNLYYICFFVVPVIVIILSCVSYFSLGQDQKSYVYIGVAVVTLHVITSLFTSPVISELLYDGKILYVNKLTFIVQAIRVVVSVMLVWMGGGVLSILIVNFISILSLLFIFNLSSSNVVRSLYPISLEQSVISFVLRPAKKTLLIKLGGFLIMNSLSVLVMRLPPSTSGQYLFSNRLLLMCYQLSRVPFQVVMPRLVKLRAENRLTSYKKVFFRHHAYSMTMHISMLILLYFFGDAILSIAGLNDSLLSNDTLIILFVIYTLELNHVIHSMSYETTNDVPFVFISILSGLSILTISWLVIPEYGLIGMLLSQLIVQLLGNNWYPVYLNLKSFRT